MKNSNVNLIGGSKISRLMPNLKRIAKGERLNISRLSEFNKALNRLYNAQAYIEPALSSQIGIMVKTRANLN